MLGNNATFLTLIPKEIGSEDPGKFRPIALCNVIYKIITKVIANRLRPLLPILISPEQAGFVEGRQILDGIILVHEVIHSLKQDKTPGMLLKLDLSKAYDKLNWDFLKGILRSFGFEERWIRWISNLVSSTFFSILVNGTPSQPFPASRGIRQGDPLSPFLFIIIAEGLGRMLRNMQTTGQIRGLKISDHLAAQTHQQFVDDNMLMGPSSVREARGIKQGLDLFLTASGLDINKEKSQVYFFNTSKVTKRNILRILEFSEGSLPSKYLGAPMAESTIRQVSWKELLDKMKQKLNLWTYRSLNFPSRLVLVKSVLQAMPLYLFSVLSAPKAVLKQIRNIQRTFLWGGSLNDRKWALVAWKTLCSPKESGGLGLRDPILSNRVMSAKIWWRWVTHSSEPWATLWHTKYAPNWPKTQLIRYDQNPPGSHIWQAAQQNRDLVQKHSFWEIRAGTEALFLMDAWQQKPRLMDLDGLGNLPPQLQNLQTSNVRDFWATPSNDPFHRDWHPAEWWQHRVPAGIAEIILSELNKRRIPILEGPDVIRWGYSNKGTFSIKEAIHLQQDGSEVPQDDKWRKIWQHKFWPKIALFCWLLIRGRILTWENLVKRGMTGPSHCVLCLDSSETTSHLLDECPFAATLWDQGDHRFRRTSRRQGSPADTVAHWPPNVFRNVILNRIWELFPGFVVWEIWKERNRRIFEGKAQSHARAWSNIELHLKETLGLQAWTQEDFKADI